MFRCVQRASGERWSNGPTAITYSGLHQLFGLRGAGLRRDPTLYDPPPLVGTESQQAQAPEAFVVDAIRTLLGRRHNVAPVTVDARLQEDLELDSLELAELSAMLEDQFGRDPYSHGVVPSTVGEIVAFYE